jgi:nitroimidazol reductase NimA-like FMN-containing flavoprotein (pyridoxamine 5'-phosphate oxidase superfamily)
MDFMSREMRRSDKEMGLDETKSFLGGARVGRLAMSKADEPYMVPVNFVYFQEKIYFHCAREGRKIDYLATNARVCFEVDEFLGVRKGDTPCASTVKYRSVIAFGKAAFVEAVDVKKEALRRLIKKYGGAFSDFVDEEAFNRTSLVAITVEWMTGKQSP